MPTMQDSSVWSLGWEDSLEKEMATHSSILAWRIPRTWRATVLGVKKSWTWLSDFHSLFGEICILVFCPFFSCLFFSWAVWAVCIFCKLIPCQSNYLQIFPQSMCCLLILFKASFIVKNIVSLIGSYWVLFYTIKLCI